jgi:aquaporin Z
MAYSIGHISGCHLNPAVSIGLWTADKFETKELIPYIVVQLLGAVVGAGVLYLIVTGKSGFEIGGFASNGYDGLSPDGYSMTSALLIEMLLTFIFLFIILGSTSNKAPAGFAPIAIGLGLTLIHLISIPITNTSVNPARSTAAALFAETEALSQLWLFWFAPIVGAVIAGVLWKWLSSEK